MTVVDTQKEPANGRRILSFSLFFFVFNFILALLEFWIWKSYQMDLLAWPSLGRWFSAIFLVGSFSIPTAFVVSFNTKSGRSHFLSWIGFIWLGLLNSFIPATLIYNLFPNVISGDWALEFSIATGVVALIFGLLDPKVKHHRIPGFPHLSGLRIVQLTDVHLGMLYLQKSWWLRQIQRVNALKAHMVVITGDLVEGSFEQVSHLVDMAQNIQAEHRFFITGNHEYIHGGEIWSQKMRNLGWTTLHNENQIVHFDKSEVMIAGVPDRMVRRFGGAGESLPDQALRSDKKGLTRILLAHEPASALDCVQEKPDFIFSGHTHGGQMWPFNLLVRLQQPVVSGWKTIQGIRVYASCGTGFWGPPMRLGTRSEITIFEFE